MSPLPFYLYAVFGFAVIAAFMLFYAASSYSGKVFLFIPGWVILQSAIALTGFYTNTDVMPPRFLLLVAPPMLLTVLLFVTARGRRMLDLLNVRLLVLLHVVRVPIEIVLFGLYIEHCVPELMTFSGRNFDIVAGITAPLVYYFGYVKNKQHRRLLIAWNIAGLALLLNIVIHAVLAVPTPFQQLAFEQPNIAILYFPFVLLPGLLVPLVLLSHLVTLRSLLKQA
jgi:hypothetical protein